MFGVFWVFLSPLFMLSIFAYVFGQIYPTKWTNQNGIPYWLQIYAGLITFNLFAETVSRAPTSVRSYPSYVKKIIFPLHILPVVPLGAALLHSLFNYLVLLVALSLSGHWHAQVLLFPFVLIPVALLALGLAWFLGAWGVFIKDMTQIVPMFLQVLMFVSPVFYPSEAVPALLRPLYLINPIGVVIETNRSLADGMAANWMQWLMTLGFALIGAMVGNIFFQYARGEFADAL